MVKIGKYSTLIPGKIATTPVTESFVALTNIPNPKFSHKILDCDTVLLWNFAPKLWSWIMWSRTISITRSSRTIYRRGDINVYQQRRGTGLFLCLNEPLHCPMAFLILYEISLEFQKQGPWRNHYAHTHRQANNNKIAMILAHTARHWRHRSPRILCPITKHLKKSNAACFYTPIVLKLLIIVQMW